LLKIKEAGKFKIRVSGRVHSELLRWYFSCVLPHVSEGTNKVFWASFLRAVISFMSTRPSQHNSFKRQSSNSWGLRLSLNIRIMEGHKHSNHIKWQDSEYCILCGSYGLCCNSSPLLLYQGKQPQTRWNPIGPWCWAGFGPWAFIFQSCSRGWYPGICLRQCSWTLYKLSIPDLKIWSPPKSATFQCHNRKCNTIKLFCVHY
jgi:hypothetical protein